MENVSLLSFTGQRDIETADYRYSRYVEERQTSLHNTKMAENSSFPTTFMMFFVIALIIILTLVAYLLIWEILFPWAPLFLQIKQ